LILFDLDGTLVDSRQDIADAMNGTLERLGQMARPVEELISYVGDGVAKLVERSLSAALGQPPSEQQLAAAIAIYRADYGERFLNTTRPYPGIQQALEKLCRLPLAVVSNKPTDLSERILSGLGLRSYFRRVWGGDATERGKPDPQPLLLLAAELGVEPAWTAMVGDSCNDVRAGRAAGMRTVGCAWGFRGAAELVACGADQVLASPLLLPPALGII
jgi:phosphoglycolate phosphatase